ncbi:DUF4148 domain-containing protein [Paraburkholderia humisilvae]|uniref:DUF4148 domain-containing protein n=1 Tax=Paraburkholderia humisilvae TaxID=627669 RepID=A0A6J5F4D5_9BURK|nr:DUF4148 domain-containing protein [Paraburkholderia humisilvae]CAB3773648.1 hypothetical protein LMG29542_07365 [Paraburkholderia humisilvae]
MNIKSIIAASLIAVASLGMATSASAAGKTRAEVRQELIDAQANGLNYTDGTYYPEASPGFTAQVEHMREQAKVKRDDEHDGKSVQNAVEFERACVGPRSFCQTYFGR